MVFFSVIEMSVWTTQQIGRWRRNSLSMEGNSRLFIDSFENGNFLLLTYLLRLSDKLILSFVDTSEIALEFVDQIGADSLELLILVVPILILS